MEPRATLPLDIFLYIIDLLAGGVIRDIGSLRILSQACKSMLPLCRKHLFSSLHLHLKLNSKRFSDLLLKNPDIACYVRSLDYVVYNPISEHELNILDMLKKHSSLQSIELKSSGSDWNDFPASIRSSLVTLIQLPTVAKLYIQYFRSFPAMALSGCSNLIGLQLIDLELAPPEVNQVVSRSKIPKPISLYVNESTYGLTTLLNSASLHADGPIVDFSRLQKAEFALESGGDIGQVNELIEVTTRLESLSISIDTTLNVDRPVWLTGLGASLATNAYRTLKLLALTFTVGDDQHPLCGLSRELAFIAGINILEELELDVMIVQGDSFQTEDWSAFDSVLTGSGAFPMLHRVSVLVWWYEEASLKSMNKYKFPRLVESKAVEFNFSVRF